MVSEVNSYWTSKLKDAAIDKIDDKDKKTVLGSDTWNI